MTNWDEKSDAQKAIGFLAICVIVLFFVLSYLYSEKKLIISVSMGFGQY